MTDDQVKFKSLKRSLTMAGKKINHLEAENKELKSELIEAQQKLAMKEKAQEYFWDRLKSPSFYFSWLKFK